MKYYLGRFWPNIEHECRRSLERVNVTNHSVVERINLAGEHAYPVARRNTVSRAQRDLPHQGSVSISHNRSNVQTIATHERDLREVRGQLSLRCPRNEQLP